MDLLKVFFWNIGSNDLSTQICQYVHKFDSDVIVLVEDHISPSKLLRTLNEEHSKYFFCKKNNRNISIYTSFDHKSFVLKSTRNEFISLVEFKFLEKNILFGGVHLPSKLFNKADSHRTYTSRLIKNEIESTEMAVEHSNTIIVGDFNMNPFELGMVEPQGFNSVMSRRIAQVDFRKVSGVGTGKSEQYKYFYNPMWSFMGDLSKFKPGTFYFRSNHFDNHYRWHMLDQILIRPSLISNFTESSLEIIDTDIFGKALIEDEKSSRPKSQICDHLPVVFSMDLTK
jgi:hypothetical protein